MARLLATQDVLSLIAALCARRTRLALRATCRAARACPQFGISEVHATVDLDVLYAVTGGDPRRAPPAVGGWFATRAKAMRFAPLPRQAPVCFVRDVVRDVLPVLFPACTCLFAPRGMLFTLFPAIHPPGAVPWDVSIPICGTAEPVFADSVAELALGRVRAKDTASDADWAASHGAAAGQPAHARPRLASLPHDPTLLDEMLLATQTGGRLGRLILSAHLATLLSAAHQDAVDRLLRHDNVCVGALTTGLGSLRAMAEAPAETQARVGRVLRSLRTVIVNVARPVLPSVARVPFDAMLCTAKKLRVRYLPRPNRGTPQQEAAVIEMVYTDVVSAAPSLRQVHVTGQPPPGALATLCATSVALRRRVWLSLWAPSADAFHEVLDHHEAGPDGVRLVAACITDHPQRVIRRLASGAVTSLTSLDIVVSERSAFWDGDDSCGVQAVRAVLGANPDLARVCVTVAGRSRVFFL